MARQAGRDMRTDSGVARCGGCGHWCYVDEACEACGTTTRLCQLCNRHPGGPHGLCVACVRAAQLAGVEADDVPATVAVIEARRGVAQ